MKSLIQKVSRWLRRKSQVHVEEHHPLSGWMEGALARARPVSGSVVVLVASGIVSQDTTRVDDHVGVLRGMSRHLGVSQHQAFSQCLDFARQDIRFGAWRLFQVDEVLMGQHCRKVMASRD